MFLSLKADGIEISFFSSFLSAKGTIHLHLLKFDYFFP